MKIINTLTILFGYGKISRVRSFTFEHEKDLKEFENYAVSKGATVMTIESTVALTLKQAMKNLDIEIGK